MSIDGNILQEVKDVALSYRSLEKGDSPAALKVSVEWINNKITNKLKSESTVPSDWMAFRNAVFDNKSLKEIQEKALTLITAVEGRLSPSGIAERNSPPLSPSNFSSEARQKRNKDLTALEKREESRSLIEIRNDLDKTMNKVKNIKASDGMKALCKYASLAFELIQNLPPEERRVPVQKLFKALKEVDSSIYSPRSDLKEDLLEAIRDLLEVDPSLVEGPATDSSEVLSFLALLVRRSELLDSDYAIEVAEFAFEKVLAIPTEGERRRWPLQNLCTKLSSVKNPEIRKLVDPDKKGIHNLK